MLWIEPYSMIYCAIFGGFIGGALASFAYRKTQRFNMRVMENYWRSDIRYLNSRIDILDRKISTISVVKSVMNQ
jgi:hypothetical protein